MCRRSSTTTQNQRITDNQQLHVGPDDGRDGDRRRRRHAARRGRCRPDGSDKPHDPAAYAMPLRVADTVAVLDDLGVERAPKRVLSLVIQTIHAIANPDQLRHLDQAGHQGALLRAGRRSGEDG